MPAVVDDVIATREPPQPPPEGVLTPSETDARLAIALYAVVKGLSLAIDRRFAEFDLTAPAKLLLALVDSACRTVGEIARRLQCDCGSMARVPNYE
jgi:hypothetical protein